MSIRKLNALCLTASSLLILAVLGQPAVAADLDTGYGDAPPPEAEQKVEVGSGWYIRGDMAVTEAYSVDGTSVSYKNSKGNIVSAFAANVSRNEKPSYNLSIGGGYASTFGVRGDVVVDFHQPSSVTTYNALCYGSLTDTSCTSTGRFSNYDALVNGYYDFGPWGIVSPYIGAGIGVAFGDVVGKLYDGSTTYQAGAPYHNLAWALMAGATFDVYDHTKIDIGYRYLDNGSINGVTPSGTATRTHIYYHEIRAGFRYMLDN